MSFAAAEAVVRLRPVMVTDTYSDQQVPDWSQPPAELTLYAGVADSGSVEQILDGRTPVDSDFTLYFDTTVDVTPQDRIRVRGLVCGVTGRPFLWRSPLTGWQPGTVVQVKIREG